MANHEPDRSISFMAELPRDIYWFFKKLFRKRRQVKIRVSGFVFQETEKAFLLKLNGIVAWVPKTACKVISRNGKAIELDIETGELGKKFGRSEKRD